MSWFLKGLKNYVNFSGRARRKEYWMYMLFYAIFYIIFLTIDTILGIYPVLTGLLGLAFFLPTLALTVRRLHDTNRSGWFVLINFVPIVGGIVILVFTCFDSEPEENAYGDNPKKVAA